MGLIENIIRKFTTFDRLNFEDFDKNLNKNQRLIKQYLKLIYQDMENISHYQFADMFSDKIYEDRENMYDKLMTILHDSNHKNCYASKEFPESYDYETERFAIGYSELLLFQKFYTLYYIYGTTSRTETEVNKVISRMVMLYDITKFVLIQYLLYGRGEYIEWKDDALTYDSKSNISDLIIEIHKHQETILDTFDCIKNQDIATLNNIYDKLCSFGFASVQDEVFPL